MQVTNKVISEIAEFNLQCCFGKRPLSYESEMFILKVSNDYFKSYCLLMTPAEFNSALYAAKENYCSKVKPRVLTMNHAQSLDMFYQMCSMYCNAATSKVQGKLIDTIRQYEVIDYLDERIDFADGNVNTSDMYNDYVEWCKGKEHKPLCRQCFHDEVKNSLSITPKKHKTTVYEGFGFKNI